VWTGDPDFRLLACSDTLRFLPGAVCGCDGLPSVLDADLQPEGTSGAIPDRPAPAGAAAMLQTYISVLWGLLGRERAVVVARDGQASWERRGPVSRGGSA
jgi:hypothetical protein